MQKPHCSFKLKIGLLFMLVFAALPVFAHTINYALQNAPVNDVILFYLKLGFQHILPLGFDHILFVVGLCLLTTNMKTIIWQATAFTIAHSITLALSMKGLIVAPPALVEPIIAISIVFIAIENLFLSDLKPWRIAVIFLFGLIHGMGFASSLNEIGLPPDQFFTSIVAFNVGVELGQIAVIAAVFGLVIIPLRQNWWYKKGIVYPMSITIALIAGYWTIIRM